MIFDFIIIPVNNTFIDDAYYIQHKIEEIYCISHILIDTNYNTTLSYRSTQLQQQYKYNIITINEDYNETNTIDVMFAHTDFKSENIPLRDFLNLVDSYTNEIDLENNHTFKCSIM